MPQDDFSATRVAARGIGRKFFGDYLGEDWYGSKALEKRNKTPCSESPIVAGDGRKMRKKVVVAGGGTRNSHHRSDPFLGGV